MKHEQWLKKIGYKETEIHMGMFDYSINFVVGPYENIDEYIQTKFDDDEFCDADLSKGFEPRGKCLYCAGFRPVIWIPKKPRKEREYATLAHECLHAMYHVFRWAGMPADDSTEEVMTHGTAHIYYSALKSFKK